MPDQPSITIIKDFPYRGTTEEFSNTYHFSGTTPADAAAWKTLADAIILAEKPTVPSYVRFVRAYGYEAGNNVSVAQIDYKTLPLTPVLGTFTVGTSIGVPGDVAATIRWATPNFTERGKRIYLRKYMHGVREAGGNFDLLDTDEKAAMQTFAAKMIDGTLPGSFKYCGPQGAVASAPLVAQYLTTRTLKRRGKRPPTATP